MEYIKYGADEARRELIDGEGKTCFNIYDLELVSKAELDNVAAPGWYFQLSVSGRAYVMPCGDEQEAERIYQLVKKDWDWWLEQEAANLDDDDEEGDC